MAFWGGLIFHRINIVLFFFFNHFTGVVTHTTEEQHCCKLWLGHVLRRQPCTTPTHNHLYPSPPYSWRPNRPTLPTGPSYPWTPIIHGPPPPLDPYLLPPLHSSPNPKLTASSTHSPTCLIITLRPFVTEEQVCRRGRKAPPSTQAWAWPLTLSIPCPHLCPLHRALRLVS